MTKGSQRLAREARVAVSQPQIATINVRSVTPEAEAAGLTIWQAQDLILLADQWRYLVLRCPGCDLITSQVLVADVWVWRGHPLAYCCGCGEVRFAM